MKSILLNLICFYILAYLTGKEILAQDFFKVEVGPHVTDSAESEGCAWADYDQDGDMDIYICKNSGDKNNLLYRNENSNGNNWVEIKLKGTASNASAIGAVIRVKANTGVTVNQLLTITERMPESYLRAKFEADTTLGMDELSVKFTDRSIFDPGNPITSWSWDFNGDDTEDSNEQNPVHDFTNAESELFDISLVISNGTNTDTIYRPGLIKVLPPDCNLALLGKATASSEEDILCLFR
jgi:PKD repeat protein